MNEDLLRSLLVYVGAISATTLSNFLGGILISLSRVAHDRADGAEEFLVT